MKKAIGMAMLWLILCVALAHADGFTLTSDQARGQLTLDQVFSGFGCTGKNISPALQWSAAPKGTQSYAVTLYDPDAPTGAGWWHWLIFNIPSNVTGLETGAGNIEKNLAPQGSVQSVTSYGTPGFGGACPPPGDKPHRYIFTVFALDIPKIDLDAKTTPAVVGYTLNQHAIAKASIIAYYGR